MKNSNKLDKFKQQWLKDAVKAGATNYILAQELKTTKEQVKQWKKLYL